MRRIAVCALLALMAACHGKPPVAAGAGAPLEIADLAAGAGAAIGVGQTAVVKYTGWIFDAAAPDRKGALFDSSEKSGTPFRFKLGVGQVIKGWDEGVAGMKAGGRRRLTIPPEFAYGDSGAGGVIPPSATLVFDVELVAIE
jgi:FKBP-type peptidyl-prolyl cis-trans isomerase FkpA